VGRMAGRLLGQTAASGFSSLYKGDDRFLRLNECTSLPTVAGGCQSPPGLLRSQLHRRRCSSDADDGVARVMLAVRLRRVGNAACDHDAQGVKLACAADNGVVIVNWIRGCHSHVSFDG
jgi:hypothetical protein